MKCRYPILLAITLPFILSACTLLGGKAAEEPVYRVTLKDGPIEVREYEGYAIARTTVTASYREATRMGFRRLFGYITGDNQTTADIDITAPVLITPQSQTIEMTAPVLIEPQAGSKEASTLADDGIDAWSVAFVLPQGYTKASAPQPQNERITVMDIDAHRIACIVFRGRLNDKSAEASRKELEKWLEARGLEHAGDWQIAGYNPPWTLPALRRNEVLVSLP
ncbi:MAG: heme-binding protein [Proteobacteria bacterium]|nr:heme-binding protein [Pseudomonadota bacterium]